MNKMKLLVILVLLLCSMLGAILPSQAHETTLIFGYTTIGALTHIWDGGDDLIGVEYTSPTINVTADSITVYLAMAGGAHNVKCAIYVQSTLAFVDETEERSISGTAWFTFNFATPPSLNASTAYLLSVWANDGAGNFVTYYDAGAVAQTIKDTEVYNGFPDPFSNDFQWNEEASIYCTYSVDYSYTFYGLYDEGSGDEEGSVVVTAHFEGKDPEEFTVNGIYNFYHDTKPIYFKWNLTSTLNREYWLEDDEDVASIYLFNATSLTTYTISFFDLAGILNSESIIEARRYVNSTVHTIEKRRVDVEKKVVMNLVADELYTLIIITSGSTYTFGDLRMTSTTLVTLTLKGIEFPKETLLTYKNVRIYGDRAFDNPTGNITITYEDLLAETNSVYISIDYKNGTNAYNATEVVDSFSHIWTSAINATDYRVVCTINHTRYGVYTWRQYFPALLSTVDWSLDFLGSPLFNTAYLLPSLLIVFAAGCFTVLNAQVGAFLTVVVAAILAYMGWLPIAPATLIIAFALSILMALVYAKRRQLG